MTVSSYAQNLEDVLLWRSLKNIEAGTYIDAGAGHPEYHSVTKLFYDAGWSGINIEPLPDLARALEAARTRDINVHAAVTDAPVDTIDLTIVDSWNELSTTSSNRAEELASEGRSLTKTAVPARKLSEIIDAAGITVVHFLKIDVEGSELDALATIDLSKIRPWIVLIEVVSTRADERTRLTIRDLMEKNDYRHAYFDGINDFYLASEHDAEFRPNFAVPVNVTDDYTVVGDSDGVFVGLVGDILGMSAPVQPSEALERLNAVVRDRIEFESRYIDAVHSEEVARATAAEDLKNARIDAAAQASASFKETISSLEQLVFERERMVAWYAAEVANHRNIAFRAKRDHEADIARLTEQSSAREHGLRLAIRDLEQRMSTLLSSTSWRVTLPLRVAKRPGFYLKTLRKR